MSNPVIRPSSFPDSLAGEMKQNVIECNTPADMLTPMKRLYPGGPILANQESQAEPFRADSQVAARPVDIPQLSDRQRCAIALMIRGQTDSTIVKRLGITRVTLWRWREHHPLFRAELSRRRQELWGAAADRFRRTLFAAVRTLRKHLSHEQAMVQYRAARTLLTLAGANRFAPPDQSTDPNDYLNEFALARRKEIHNPDFTLDPATDSERISALATLLAKAEEPPDGGFEGEGRGDTIGGNVECRISNDE